MIYESVLKNNSFVSRTSFLIHKIMADTHSNNNQQVPVLFSFSVSSRPSSVPVGSGYEVLIQKFMSIYGRQIDVHRKLVLQYFSEEWGQYIDLPKGFVVSEKCRLRLVPLQMDVSSYFTHYMYESLYYVTCYSVKMSYRHVAFMGGNDSVCQTLLDELDV